MSSRGAFNVPRHWFEINSRHQKRYSEDGKKFRWCRGLLGRVIRYAALSSEYTFKKLAVVVDVLQTAQNLVIQPVVFLQGTAKKCTKIYNSRAQLLFCSLNLLPLPSWFS